jgi:hypothetical protein
VSGQTRTVRLSRGVFLASRRLTVDQRRAVSAVIDGLEQAELPSPGSLRILLPPVMEGWALRVPRYNLWVVHTFGSQEVFVRAASRRPPVPAG